MGGFTSNIVSDDNLVIILCHKTRLQARIRAGSQVPKNEAADGRAVLALSGHSLRDADEGVSTGTSGTFQAPQPRFTVEVRLLLGQEIQGWQLLGQN